MKRLVLLLSVAIVSCGLSFDSEQYSDSDVLDGNGHSGPDRMCPSHMSGEQVVDHYAYSLAYSEVHEQPLWVAYMVSADRVAGEVGRSNWFHEDESISTGSAQYYDYKNSGYSRGHLVPAGDMKWDSLAMVESFFMSNMSPQLQNFNSGVWNRMEEQVRRWASLYDTLYVVTGPVLTEYGLDAIDAFSIDGGKIVFETIGVDTDISVPFFFFKAVYDPDRGEALAFLVPHEGTKAHISNFVVGIDVLESALGFDLFPQVDDAVENRMEARSAEECIAGWVWN